MATYTGNAYITANTLNWLYTTYGIKNTGDNPSKYGAKSDLQDWYAQLNNNIGYNPFDSIDEYLPDLEKGPLGDLENIFDNTSVGSLTEQLDFDYFNYTFFDHNTSDGTPGSQNTSYSIVDDVFSYSDADISGGENAALGYTNARNFYVNNIVGGAYGDAEKIKLYKNLSDELEYMKDYTLTNQEIIDIQEKIENLNTNILSELSKQIEKVSQEFEKVLDTYATATPWTTNPLDAAEFAQLYGGGFSDYAGHKNDRKDMLFGGHGGSYTPENSLFYEFCKDKRSEPDLEFGTSVAQKFPKWETEAIVNTDTDNGGVDTADYPGLEEGAEKFDMVDLIQEHFVFQELMSLYEKYEEAQNEASALKMSLEVATRYCVEFEFRKDLATEIWNDFNDEQQDVLSNYNLIVNGIQRGNGYGPSALSPFSEYSPEFYGFYGNATDPDDELASSQQDYMTKNGGLVDPYEFNLNGVDYIMGIDKNRNGLIDDTDELLGINDILESPFESLVSLDVDKDGFVSQSELIDGGIIFNAVNENEQLTKSSLDTTMIKGIDLYSLKQADDNSDGIAGTFEVKTSNGKIVEGKQTFEDQKYFNNLFGSLVDLSPYQSGTELEGSEDSNSYYSNFMKNLENIYSNVDTSTSSSEAVLEKVCWETGTILTPAQKLRVLEVANSSISAQSLENIIRAEIETLNLSA